jgi:hypothetical protein
VPGALRAYDAKLGDWLIEGRARLIEAQIQARHVNLER